jgi:rubrerythrin
LSKIFKENLFIREYGKIFYWGDKMKMSCKKCGARLSIGEVEEAKDTCPFCKQKTSWFSEPEFFGVFKK